MTGLPLPSPLVGFSQASESVVEYLRTAVPLGYWSVTRYDGSSQVHLTVRGDAFGLAAGQVFDWEDTLCQHAVSGAGPRVAPDVGEVPVYADMPAVQELGVGAYVGIPIVRADGNVFGTICGLDPARQPAALGGHAALLELLAGLLASILDGDLDRMEAARLLERAELLADTDELTGLANRRAWEQFMSREEERYRRYGDPAAVLMIDLDGLKALNDQAGHTAGDELLQLAAVTIRSTVRGADLAARLGGDEFGVIAVRTNKRQAHQLVARIRASFGAAGVAASIGQAPFTFETGFHGAWQRADEAMYEDKRRRKASASPSS